MSKSNQQKQIEHVQIQHQSPINNNNSNIQRSDPVKDLFYSEVVHSYLIQILESETEPSLKQNITAIMEMFEAVKNESNPNYDPVLYIRAVRMLRCFLLRKPFREANPEFYRSHLLDVQPCNNRWLCTRCNHRYFMSKYRKLKPILKKLLKKRPELRFVTVTRPDTVNVDAMFAKILDDLRSFQRFAERHPEAMLGYTIGIHAPRSKEDPLKWRIHFHCILAFNRHCDVVAEVKALRKFFTRRGCSVNVKRFSSDPKDLKERMKEVVKRTRYLLKFGELNNLTDILRFDRVRYRIRMYRRQGSFRRPRLPPGVYRYVEQRQRRR